MAKTAMFFIFLVVIVAQPRWVLSDTELRALMELKASLDPKERFLSSWTVDGDPCDGSFLGVGCNERGQVVNISLQGKGLSGEITPAIAGLKCLTGLYLHCNALSGEVPANIVNLTQLTDLYLNMNNLSGEIPPEIGNMISLQVLQLCYNHFTGSIPNQLGSLKKLSVLALQNNHLAGAIPATLGDLSMLTRLDLGSNHLFGSIPSKLANAPLLRVLDVRNNNLSGSVPPALKRLEEGFIYENNTGLCGFGFSSLQACEDSYPVNPSKPEGVTDLPNREIPESADFRFPCNASECMDPTKSRNGSVVPGTVVVSIVLSALAIIIFTFYRRRKQKLGGRTSLELSESRFSIDQPKNVSEANGSPLISLEYPNGWDPLADGRNLNAFPQETFQNFRFNIEELETATQYFSESNLLGKSNFSATYRGILRDGSVVAIKCIGKTSCKSEESEFLKGLHLVASLKHENLVRLRGFCCSRGRRECFLVYDFARNGNLLRYLDSKEGGESHVLDWSTRVSIVKGIAKGVAYLHSYKHNKPPLIHQNISAEKVLIDQRYNPLLADSGLQNLLTNDVIFSAIKSSAAMGYLAPEYATTGRFNEKSDVYAFGVLVFQILSGKRKVSNLARLGAEACRFLDYVDPSLSGRFFEYEAAKLARIAWLCTHECPIERPSMEAVVHELGTCSSCL